MGRLDYATGHDEGERQMWADIVGIMPIEVLNGRTLHPQMVNREGLSSAMSAALSAARRKGEADSLAVSDKLRGDLIEAHAVEVRQLETDLAKAKAVGEYNEKLLGAQVDLERAHAERHHEELREANEEIRRLSGALGLLAGLLTDGDAPTHRTREEVDDAVNQSSGYSYLIAESEATGGIALRRVEAQNRPAWERVLA